MDQLLLEYDCDLALDGKRTGVTEKQLVDTTLQETRIDWFYDQLGRLTREVYDSYDDSLDYTADYVMDLVGNRLSKKTDSQPTAQQLTDYRSGAAMASQNVDEAITSTYDANDRLLKEFQDVAGTANNATTLYEYGPNADPANAYGGDGTQQTRNRLAGHRHASFHGHEAERHQLPVQFAGPDVAGQRRFGRRR